MSLGAGAEKVEGPIVQKRSVALEATMANQASANHPTKPPTAVLRGRRDRENWSHGTSKTPTPQAPSMKTTNMHA